VSQPKEGIQCHEERKGWLIKVNPALQRDVHEHRARHATGQED